MQDQWFYSGWVPPQKRSRERLATPAPCIVHMANGSIGPHGWEMLLAASISVATFGPPPSLPERPNGLRPGKNINKKVSQPWSMARIFGQWYKSNSRSSAVILCPICLQPMRRLNEGGVSSNTAPKGRRWVTVDHIIHVEHEECRWCVWPMCNECNSSKGTVVLKAWLPGRLEDVGRNANQIRTNVKKTWNAIQLEAPEGQMYEHDCADAMPFRKSYGCAAGVHDWKRLARGRARCQRRFCGELGAWDRSTEGWRATGKHLSTCEDCGRWTADCDCP